MPAPGFLARPGADGGVTYGVVAGAHGSDTASLVSDQSRHTSPGASARPSIMSVSAHASSAAAAAAAASAPKARKKKGKVAIAGEDETSRSLTRQLASLQAQLDGTNAALAEKDGEARRLEARLEDARAKEAETLRAGAARMARIKELEAELERERARNELMAEELLKQTRMLDQVCDACTSCGHKLER